MSNLIDWNPATHPFHKMLQVGDVIAAASATFFRETYVLAYKEFKAEEKDKDFNRYESALEQSCNKYRNVRTSLLSLMPEGNRHTRYFGQDLYQDCVRYCENRNKQVPNDLYFCLDSVLAMFELLLSDYRIGSGWADTEGNPTEWRKSRKSDEDTLRSYPKSGLFVKVCF